MSAAPARQWAPLLALIALGWGSSFLFIELALRSFSPSQVGFGRLAVGALVLWLMVAAQRRRPRLGLTGVAAVAAVGLFMSGIPLILIPMAQQSLTSILASLLNATTPLWTAFFVALLIPAERISRSQLAGLLVGVLGIAILVGAWNVADFPLGGVLLMLGATACYGIGSTLSRRLLARVDESHTVLSATQIGVSAVMLAPFAVVSGSPEPSAFALDSVALWGLIGLGVLGTSYAYVLFWRVVKIAGATTASSVTYLVPVVATTLGVLVLGEKLHWYEVAGAAVVLVGVWLAGRKPRTPVVPTETDLAA
ncbi:DMT family transporter [Demequina zhanjiangensis]|uniref:DMT family transporter n=1 Tax=Demequina zhanjiangensis TaxID=3051659 RepID=A0ABT8FZ58_9MICO|nr:DMT family transporter [Demequina sp. SYSU T00b26]MDN4472186.1 DMT family transporter [Demequina sp. SYSU T00b26]